MEDLISKIEAKDWDKIASDMHGKGYAFVPKFLSAAQCRELISCYDQHGIYRKTVVMERYRFGSGEYKYFDYPLPEPIQTIREHVYPKIAPIANVWMEVLKIDKHFPGTFWELKTQCHNKEQCKPTPLILKYGKGGFNTLHQDLYGDVYFPMQAVFLLNEPGIDFTGGEFVLVQQTPRAQSKAIVLQPNRGDMLLFATNFRPVKGTRGYYRAGMRHGVSEIRAGERHALGVIFHDAKR